MNAIGKCLLAAALLAFVASNAMAENEVNYKQDKLSGDWDGQRTTLANSGVDVEIIDRADWFANLSGGVDEGSAGFNQIDIALSFDGEKLAGLKGTSALFHVFNNSGGHPSAKLVGDAQTFDNYEVPENTTQIYQAWIQQNFFDDKLSLLGGIYDFNSEFNVTESSLLFIHSAYGMNSEIALSGANGAPIFPFTGLGGRVKVAPTDNSYVMATMVDGFPGSREHLSGTHMGVHDGEGWLVAGEAGIITGGEKPNGKVAVGGWYYTEKLPDITTSELERSEGMYLIGEYELSKGLTGFLRLGFADGDVQQFDYTWATGVVYTGLFAGRDEGQLGFGINSAHSSSAYRAANAPVDSAETALELTYADKITPWMAIQPDVQYIINPGTDPTLDNSFIVGARLIVDF